VNEQLTIEVTTRVFGLGAGRATRPAYIALRQRTVSARELIAEHVRAELAQMQERRAGSLALHYMLADDLRREPTAPLWSKPVDPAAEIRRAWRGLVERRFVLVVDGASIDELDASITLTERSQVVGG
jgi:hypothetical protein